MKRVKAALFLLLAALGVVVWSSLLVHTTFSRLDAALCEVTDLCGQGRFGRAKQVLTKAEEDFSRAEHTLALFIRRDMLGQMQLELAGVSAYAIEDAFNDLSCEAAHARAQLAAIRHLYFSFT